MTRIYAMVNQKGGVGKTTTAISLGAYLAVLGQRVLLVDIDPQANATSCLGIDKTTIEDGIYGVLVDGMAAEGQLLHNPKLNLWLLPSSPALAGAEVELVGAASRESRLHKALQPLLPSFDYILIDCPPAFGLVTLNGLVGATGGAIVPVQCEYLALEGLSQLTQTINRVRSALNSSLSIRGLLMTMYDGRSNLSRDVVAEVSKHFPGRVFRSIIPRSVRLAEAPSHGLPISAYAPSSPGGLAYKALAEEVLEGDGMTVKQPPIAEPMNR